LFTPSLLPSNNNNFPPSHTFPPFPPSHTFPPELGAERLRSSRSLQKILNMEKSRKIKEKVSEESKGTLTKVV